MFLNFFQLLHFTNEHKVNGGHPIFSYDSLNASNSFVVFKMLSSYPLMLSNLCRLTEHNYERNDLVHNPSLARQVCSRSSVKVPENRKKGKAHDISTGWLNLIIYIDECNVYLSITSFARVHCASILGNRYTLFHRWVATNGNIPPPVRPANYS